MKRRSFIEFLGKTSIIAIATPSVLAHCTPEQVKQSAGFILNGISPSLEDELILANGLNYSVLVKWGDKISSKDHFGFNNDFLAFKKIDEKESWLWVNHEYVSPRFVHLRDDLKNRSKEDVEKEMYEVGGSAIKIKREESSWKMIVSDDNHRYTAQTPIPFNDGMEVAGSNTAIGTLANCAGGITPWGTILTCEENYDSYYGERDHLTGEIIPGGYGWEKYYDRPPEHYGWVVEIDLDSGKSRKLVSLGRCAHECATVKELSDKRVVVYTGDDANNECLYKFISSSPSSLTEGKLYVANLEERKWISLDINDHEVLRKNFKDQTEVMVRLREASKLVGGTRLDRPEDIQIDPLTGDVFIALTNNKAIDNYFGSILKISEANGKYDSLTFSHDTFLAGGEDTGFACPDNMCFDPVGNLWFTSDISGSAIGKPPYTTFKNNGLFVVRRDGAQAGEVIQIASAPNDAEFTGPVFSDDGKTLFLCVQHPGEQSKSIKKLTSHWPNKNGDLPRSAVVTIQGETIEKLQGLK